MSAPLLRVRGLTVQYGGVVAVDALDLDVDPGELMAIIGPNGAGKSTAFGAMAGAVRPTSGSVELDGRRIDRLPPEQVARFGLARTFQSVRLFRTMSVRENVMVGADIVEGSMADARRRADDVLDRLGLNAMAERSVLGLPLADQKRVEIARAIAANPRVLLLDEMMSGLTRSETDDLTAVIRDLNEAGLTVVVIEHVLRVVLDLAERALVLDHGAAIAEGTPEAVMSDPQVVEAYLGRSAVKELEER